MQTGIASTQYENTVEKHSRSNGIYRVEKILGQPLWKDPWACVVTITPEKAAAILEHRMPLQRYVRRTRVEDFAEAIKKGEFRTTHQGIAFNLSGQLVDGQHRLAACVMADMPITVMAAFNQPNEDFMAYDRGTTRSLADDLVVMGVSEIGVSIVVQAAGKILFQFDNGKIPWTNRPKPSATDIDMLAQKHPHFLTLCDDVYHNNGNPSVPQGPTSAFFTLFWEVDASKAERLLYQIRTGEGLSLHDPALVLRNSMSREDGRRAAVTRNSYMVRLVHCWNNFRAGRKVRSLLGVLQDDAFPKISGYRGG